MEPMVRSAGRGIRLFSISGEFIIIVHGRTALNRWPICKGGNRTWDDKR
jgi:hypothetical protein